MTMKLLICLMLTVIVSSATGDDQFKPNPELDERWELYKVTNRFMIKYSNPLYDVFLTTEKFQQKLR